MKIEISKITDYNVLLDLMNLIYDSQGLTKGSSPCYDGKAMDIFVESHPLPVIVCNLGVVKAKVLD